MTRYARILQTNGMKAWLAVVLLQRLPVSMSLLAFVYLGEHVTGSYAAGAVLAGAFAIAEAAFAGSMGRRFDRRPAGSEMQLVLGVQAGALLLLGLLPATAPDLLPIGGLVALAALAGGVAAGAHGGLRALLVRIVPPETTQAALSMEATITALMWALGPALVAVLVVLAGPIAPLFVTALLAGAGALAARRLPDPGRAEARELRGSVWNQAWPAMVQEGAVLLMIGTAYATLPALLESVGAASDLAGPALAGLAVAGIAGGLIYGMRTWPGTYRAQVVVLVVVTSGLIAAVAVAPGAAAIIALVVAAGLFETPALTARAAALQEQLPESRWAAGFSGLYAAGGAGFAGAGLVIAPLLIAADPRLAFVLAAFVALSAALLAGWIEARRSVTPASPARRRRNAAHHTLPDTPAV
jgi:MFS family permease